MSSSVANIRSSRGRTLAVTALWSRSSFFRSTLLRRVAADTEVEAYESEERVGGIAGLAVPPPLQGGTASISKQIAFRLMLPLHFIVHITFEHVTLHIESALKGPHITCHSSYRVGTNRSSSLVESGPKLPETAQAAERARFAAKTRTRVGNFRLGDSPTPSPLEHMPYIRDMTHVCDIVIVTHMSRVSCVYCVIAHI